MYVSDPGFALYVHWPFCLSKCPYCDFNSHVVSGVDHKEWQSALLSELDHYGHETKARRLTSVFFGGGTPSLMAPDTVAAILERLSKWWHLSDELEITLEANPTSIEAGRFQSFRAAGINRVSVGIQSLNDETLRFLGREHSARDACQALKIAADTFDRYSFDLIYALAGQSQQAWEAELTQALELAGDHLSLYQLTIEPGTPFFRDDIAVLDDDCAADMYEHTQSIMEASGRPAYEISNHAKLGSECRHNLTYWKGGDYVGIGPGAHGRVTTGPLAEATHQIHNPQNWLEAVNTHRHGTAKRRSLTQQVRAQELIMMGLRLTDGLDLTSITQQAGLPLSDVVDTDGQQHMIDGGFIENQAGDHLKTTAAGKLCLNSVIKHLLK
jgi:putative oxygen-independent coproporphyrinogen III oxidase